jgi:phage terminase large subunit
MPNETFIKLHPKQFEAFNFKKQFGAAICGVQSGKTFVGAVWAVHQAVTKFPKGVGLIVSPTIKVLNQSTLEKFFDLAPEFRQFYKKMEGVIELPTGGKIFIRSADRPEGLEGMTLDWCWADEAGQMPRMFWTVIKARVSAKQAQVFLTSTPYSLNWFYTDIWEAFKTHEDDRVEVFTWRTIDNPVFQTEGGRAYLEAEKRAMSNEEFARRYLGEFTKMEGLVWDLPKEQIIDISTPQMQQVLRFPDRVIGGVDWGFNNPAAIVIIKVKDAVYYVVDEWKASGRTTKEIVEQAKEFKDKYNVGIWYPDPAEPDRIQEFKEQGLGCGETKKDIGLGVSEVQRLIGEERMFIADSCIETLDEMNQYHWNEPKDGRNDREVPVKFNDHLMDALRYACMGYRAREPKAKPQDYLSTKVRLQGILSRDSKTTTRRDPLQMR